MTDRVIATDPFMPPKYNIEGHSILDVFGEQCNGCHPVSCQQSRFLLRSAGNAIKRLVTQCWSVNFFHQISKANNIIANWMFAKARQYILP